MKTLTVKEAEEFFAKLDDGEIPDDFEPFKVQDEVGRTVIVMTPKEWGSNVKAWDLLNEMYDEEGHLRPEYQKDVRDFISGRQSGKQRLALQKALTDLVKSGKLSE